MKHLKTADKPTKPENKKKMNKVLKALIIILSILLALIIVMASTITVMHFVGKNELENDNESKKGISTPDSPVVDTQDDGKVISYKGEKYHLNDSIITLLCIGVDKHARMGSDNGIIGTGGHADALYLLAIDLEKDECDIVGISRDTMTDIEVYSTSGNLVGQSKMQICLSYAYGDGYETSCENTVRAVSRALYGLDIDMYFAIETTAIGTINDDVGGVTVTPSQSFTVSQTGKSYYKGVPTTLYGIDAENYVRYRDLSVVASNNDRMQRQKDYITAFMNQMLDATKTDLTVPVDVYNDIVDSSVTNMSASKLTYIVTSLFSNGMPKVNISRIDGTVKKLGKYAAFYPDEDSLLDTLVNVFYIPDSEYKQLQNN